MIVLDTDVVSEGMRPHPDPAVVGWLNAQAVDTLFLSSVSLAELLFGLGVLPAGARRDRLMRALDRLSALFAGRVLAFDQEAAARYADMAVAARALADPCPPRTATSPQRRHHAASRLPPATPGTSTRPASS